MAGIGRFDATTAAEWRAMVVPSWTYRWALPVLWAVALAVSAFSDTERCSAADPSVCGPDLQFSIWAIACFATVLAQWWVPRVGWVCGVVFAVGDVLYDDVQPARVVWSIVGIACLGLLIWSEVARSRQRQIDAGLSRVPAWAGQSKRIGVTWQVLGAAGLATVGLGSLAVMRWMDEAESGHLSRSVVQDSTVHSVDADGDLELELADGSRRKVTPLDGYRTGDVIPVRVDPADSEWVRMVAEPADNTYWYTIAGVAWLGAIVLMTQDRRRRVAARQGPSVHGVPVLVRFDADGLLAVFPLQDDEKPVAYLPVDYDDAELDAHIDELPDDAFDEDIDDDDPDTEAEDPIDAVIDEFLARHNGEATLAGGLIEGAWPVVVTPAGTLRPTAPLRAPRRAPWRAVGRHVSGSGQGFVAPQLIRPPRHSTELAVVPATSVPPLPWTARPTSDMRLWDWSVFVAGLFAPVFLWWGAEDVGFGRIGAVLIAFGLGSGVISGLAHLVGRLTVQADGLTVRSLLRTRFVAWSDLEDVVLRSRSITLDLGSHGGRVTMRFREGQPTAEHVAGAIEAVRRAKAIGRSSSTKLSWGAFAAAAYVLLLGAALVHVFQVS